MDAFTAIADPVRRDLVALLRRGPALAGAVAAAFPQISRPAVSRHLRVLRGAGLVQVEQRGRERLYSLDLDGLTVVEGWLRSVRAAGWEQRLDALETEVHRAVRSRSSTAQPTSRSTA